MYLSDTEVFVLTAEYKDHSGPVEVIGVFKDDAEANDMRDLIALAAPSKNLTIHAAGYWT